MKGNIKMDLGYEAEVASGLKWLRTGSVGDSCRNAMNF